MDQAPFAISVDAAGNVYAADISNYFVRKITPDGVVSTIAGNGTPGYSGDSGPATSAHFGLISGLAADDAGNLYLADQTYNAIRLLQPVNTTESPLARHGQK